MEKEEAVFYSQSKEQLTKGQEEKKMLKNVSKSPVKKPKELEKAQIQGLRDDEIEYGEDELRNEHDFYLISAVNNRLIEGRFIITRFKIVFVPYDKELQRNEFFKKMNVIELNLIEKVTKFFNKKAPDQYYLDIFTKDFRQMRIVPRSYPNMDEIYNNLLIVAFPSKFSSSIFAFKHKISKPRISSRDKSVIEKLMQVVPEFRTYSKLPTDGWNVYKFSLEYKRMGVIFFLCNATEQDNSELYPFKAIRCWNKTKKGRQLCKTYPEYIIVPNSITNSELEGTAKFRTKGRFPGLSYYYKKNGTSLWRSSQNKGGITSRSTSDENMLLKIGNTNTITNKVVIFDARSKINAMANKLNKGGYENCDKHYTNCKLYFCDIDNIHGVRKAYEKMFQACSNQNTKGNFYEAMEKSGWINLIQKLIVSAKDIATVMDNHEKNVLIHCSDGWDRTAQLSTLAQIILDPFYRTLKGFQILIEKDWVSFGHMFELRLGHFKVQKQDTSQRSPIFIQWLDCVHQLLHQFPTAFQFNIDLLTFLAHEVYTCKYGTFLFDCESERAEMMVRKKTISIWTYVNRNLMRFLNPFYKKDDEIYSPTMGLLNTSPNMIFPMSDYTSIRIFKEHFFKYNDEHQMQQQATYGSPMEKLNKVMMKEMDLHVENTELKKLIKSMCEEMSKMQQEKEEISTKPDYSNDQSKDGHTQPESTDSADKSKAPELQKEVPIKRKPSIEVVYENKKDHQETKFVVNLSDKDENEEEKRIIYEEEDEDEITTPNGKNLSQSSSSSNEKVENFDISPSGHLDKSKPVKSQINNNSDGSEPLPSGEQPSNEPCGELEPKDPDKDPNEDHFDKEYQMEAKKTQDSL
ncbi:unnamed protein product [Moneuplotes crassus]|uniref:Myotubularin phosphatase domain-containing protein n=1 Tax=Euplotes crassus TaxID=5936 RepID=A0AAD1Y2C7_EUPCR|nr:unnamed protein product [Moneuplotes crassus]